MNSHSRVLLKCSVLLLSFSFAETYALFPEADGLGDPEQEAVVKHGRAS